ncbi:MAG: hypothetical protein ACJ719_16750, partial [Nitrososphaeraceae archaeon]
MYCCCTNSIGITLPQAGQQATRGNVIQMANLAEKEGFDSLWAFERLLWPINPQTPYPATPDGSLPIQYQIMLDPLEILAHKANKDPNNFKVVLLTYPNIVLDSKNQSTTTNESQRFPLTGTIDQ